MATPSSPTATARPADRLSGPRRPASLDRWIFVLMAVGFIALVLAGFIPDSLEKMAAVETGARRPFPLVMHLHAVLMGAYLLLFLTQTALAATGRLDWHRRLGILAAALIPALVVVGLILAQTMYREAWAAAQAAAPEVRDRLEAVLTRKENVLLVQLRMSLLFPLLAAIGLLARRADPGLHKRMMVLAVIVVLPPGIDRIAWLPNQMPASFVVTEFYMLLAVLPLFAWDTMRNGFIHRAYWIWAGVSLPFIVALHVLWDTPAWHAAARALLLF